MHHALVASATLPKHLLRPRIVDLRTRLRDCSIDDQAAWSALQIQLERTLDHHSHELYLDRDAECIRLQITSTNGFIGNRLLKADPLYDALSLLQRELWPDRSQALSQRSWFLISLYKRDYIFQIDYIRTSSGSTFTLRRLYDTKNPLPQLEELIGLPAQAARARQRLQRPHGLILLADIDRCSRVRTARALAQCLTGPDRRILLSETTCHPLVPGITQITVPLEAQEEHQQAWLQACNLSHDVIIALEIDHAPVRLTRLASENRLVIQGLAANSASHALTQLIASGTRPEAIARALTSVLVQHQIAVACEKCKCPTPLDDKLNNWISQQNPVKPGAIQDWLDDRLTDNFVGAGGCDACNHTGVEKIILSLDCVDVPAEVQDALCDGDVRYAVEYFDRKNAFPEQLVRLARMGVITIQHAIDITQSCKRQGIQ